MLLKGSIFLQVLLVFLIQCNCQDYEGNYGVEESDVSDIQEDTGHPDYSKYYSVDTSSPLIGPQGNNEATDFLSQVDFSGFFAPPTVEFGAAGKQEVAQPQNPFAPQNQKEFPEFYASSFYPIDYFEEAQKLQQQQQQKENQEDDVGFQIDGPDYISHSIPTRIEGEYSSDVETIDPKSLKKKKTKKTYDYEDKEGNAEADKYKTPDYSYEYQPSSGKYADYNIGKSSSTVAQVPQAPGYYDKNTKTATPSPYEKYSFQPVTEGFKSKYLGGLISTVAPFNPTYSKIASTVAPNIESQPSENIPSHLKGKNCIRVKKEIPGGDGHDRRKRDAMNCFVCEDPESTSKYTQCSYAVEPEPKNEYSGISERYSTPSQQPDGFRYKRYSGDENVDPYEYIKSRTQQEFTDSEKSKDYEEYKIPDFYTDAGLDKSYSELQSEAIAKNPSNCHKEESNGMTCTICKDPKTGGNFEQCSYTSEPKEQKYAYVTEKKYDSNEEPEDGAESKSSTQTKAPENKNVKEVYKSLPTNENSKYRELEDFKPSEEYKSGKYSANFASSAPLQSENQSDSKKEEYNPPAGFPSGQRTPKKLIDDEPYQIPKHFAESTIKEQKSGVKGLEPSLYGSADSSDLEDDADSGQASPYKDIDEYHFKLFPEYSNQETQQAEVVANNPSAETTRKDVEEVLAEFSKKDRSSCKKAEKNGMTCYLCVDSKGIQHEECMYISESKPQASHVAYHEVKQIKTPNNEENQQSEQTVAATEINRQLFSNKKVSSTPAPFSLVAAASQEIETKVKAPKRRRNSKKVKEPTRSASNVEASEKLNVDDEEPKAKTPVEFDVGDEEGAYSAETKPIYSKTHGVKLPRYMIEKSEFEKEFDEFAGTF